MLEKEPQKPPEHTSEHAKSQTPPPPRPPHTIYSMAPHFWKLPQALTILSAALVASTVFISI